MTSETLHLPEHVIKRVRSNIIGHIVLLKTLYIMFF